MSSTGILVVIVVAFVVGYLAVSWFIRLNVGARAAESSKQDRNDSTKEREQTGSANAYSQGRAESVHGTTTRTEAEKEQAYGRLLGLKGVITKQEVRKRYLEAIAKYHPDKVNHLAPEFQVMAEEKTKILTEAYDYFRRKYDLR